MSDLIERLGFLSDAINGTVMGGPMLIAEAQKRIEELEGALHSALYYIKRIGDDGEGGTSDHAVTLDAIQQALKKRTEFIQPASDKKVPWPSNLDPTAWK